MSAEHPKGFVAELQAMSEPKKKQVLIIATVIIMVIIVGVWFSYFNGIIASASEPTIADATSTSGAAQTPIAIAPASPAPASATANGLSMWQNIENGMASIGNIFKGPSNYNIQPSQ